MSERTDTAAGTPTQIFDLLLAYKTTAMVGSGIELGLFDALAAGPLDADTLAQRLGVPERGARLLANALAAIGLLDGTDGRYRLGPQSAAYLVRDRPGYLGDMARVMASRWEWDAFGRLGEAIRQGGPVVPEHAETPEYAYWEQFAAYAGAVAGPTARFVADALAPWADGRRRLDVLDVACGHGRYGHTLAVAQPAARVWSLDWPNVLPEAIRQATALGVADRVRTIAGDMFDVALGGPYDAVMVTNVLHHFSPERGVQLLRRAADVLVEDGRLVLVGFVTRDGVPPIQDAAAHLFSVLMLVWTYHGEVHTEATYQKMLDQAGFVAGSWHRVPRLPLAVQIAQRR
jgi:SAM-dependent methyltransferase